MRDSTARNADPIPSVSALSEYRKSYREIGPKRSPKSLGNGPSAPSTFDQSLTANCPDCGTSFHLYTKMSRGWN